MQTTLNRNGGAARDDGRAFAELLRELTLETVACEKTFRVVGGSAGGDELLRARRLGRLRERAGELGMEAGTFDARLRACGGDGAARSPDRPEWVAEGGGIDESAFCEAYRRGHGLRCISGAFYGPLGAVPDGKVKSEIQAELAPYFHSRLAARVNGLLEALRNCCYSEPPDPEPNVIHTANGELDIGAQGSFTFVPAFRFCLNRIAAEYRPGAPKPELWLKFLNDLLYPEDIPTLQEFLGYCLVPTTKAQKMLMLIGSGGEGKSVAGAAAREVLGYENTASGRLNDLDENRFAAANLENRLLFLDDDLKTKAAEESAAVKEIITCGGRMSLERKGTQAHEGNMYCRLMAFGNKDYQTLHDQSEGAYRRRILLFTKPKPEGRKDDKDLPRRLARERDGIFLWMLAGLKRLMKNDWEFTLSGRAKENLEQSKRDSFNFLAFLDDAVRLGVPDTSEFSADICNEYDCWCSENGEMPRSRKTVISYLRQNADKLKILYSNHVPKDGKQARGFYGVQLLKKHRNGISPM